jgi:hypothetical protein
MRTIRRAVVTVGLLAFAAAEADAQSTVSVSVAGPAIAGRVTSETGAPIGDVLVRVRMGARVVEARSDAAGAFRVAGLSEGSWTVSLRRIGYVADSVSVAVAGGDVTLDRQLAAAVLRLDGQVITAAWRGVRGVVGDERYQPLAGATVEIVGREQPTPVTAEGMFALPEAAGVPLLLRVRAPGHAPRLVSARVPANGSIELSVLLGAEPARPASAVVQGDLDLRMGWASPLAAYLTREDVAQVDARDLGIVMQQSPVLQARGLRLGGPVCLFVDGVARPGFPLTSVMPESVEFIEIYPRSADRSQTLARRWPPRAECGPGAAPGAGSGVGSYVVVWTRADG